MVQVGVRSVRALARRAVACGSTIAVVVVLAACEPTSSTGEDASDVSAAAGVAASTTTANESAVAAGSCVDYVMAKAYLGDRYWGQLWIDLEQDATALRTWCTDFAVADPAAVGRMTAEYVAIRRDQRAAAPLTTVPNVQPFVSTPVPTQPPAAEPPSGGNCDPNYRGCVPIASDVDCAGGSGDGPEYTSGPVEVIGVDVYGLDRDRNGWGCD